MPDLDPSDRPTPPADGPGAGGPVPDDAAAHRPGELRGATRRQIRGSSLFVSGRFISLGLNFVVQVLIANYLSKAEYGAFAYALSLVALAEVGVTLGVDRAIPRFVPIHEERAEWSRMAGTIVFVVGTIVSLGLGLVLLVLGLGHELTGRLIDDETAAALIMILIVLAPIQALDTVLMNMFAAFASPRAIFVRKYLLGPGLRLVVVLLLIGGEFGARFLALGYVLAGLGAVVLYGAILLHLLSRRGLLRRMRAGRPEPPIREILAYTVPLLSTDAVYLALNTLDAIVVGAFHGVDAVAALRVVGPLAGLNQLVATSFALLFTPAAARFFARSDRSGMDELYWQTTIWIAVLSFPIFAATFALAEPMTTLLYGERYASSAAILSVLAVGRYVDAALGLNGLTLRVWGNIRFVVIANVVAAILDIVLLALLVPPFGALGAALATAGTLVVFNVVRQVFLWRFTGVRAFDPAQSAVYATIGLAAVALLVFQVATDLPLPVGLALAAGASLAVLLVGRDRLRVGETFPELGRLPLVRRLAGVPSRGTRPRHRR